MLLEVVVKIQTETGGEEKRAAAATEGSWKVYHLTGLDAVCLVLCASLRCPPKDARALSTDTVTTRTMPHSVLLQDMNLSR